MATTPPIAVWSGCDPELGAAVDALSRVWEPYSAESRRYSIFRLLKELIDPAWSGLCIRSRALSGASLNRAWMRYKLGLLRRANPVNAAGLDGTSPPSEIARRLGFAELEHFIDCIARIAAVRCDERLERSMDTMKGVANRCRGKRKKRTSLGKFGKVDLLHDMRICRSCERPTELAHHKATMGDAAPEGAARLSSMYCSVHSPTKQGVGSRSDYLKARRSKKAFETELNRLECQCSSAPSPHARSGRSLVDNFFQLLAIDRLGEKADDVDIDDLERRLRAEARRLVDDGITDRKKEMISLISSGMNQSQVAKQLGIERQAVSKALKHIPRHYRFDLGSAA